MQGGDRNGESGMQKVKDAHPGDINISKFRNFENVKFRSFKCRPR